MKKIFIYILLALFFSCKKNKGEIYDSKTIDIKWVQKPKHAIVGQTIEFSFENNLVNTPMMIVTSAFGATIIKGVSKNNNTKFCIPKHITLRSGVLSYYISYHEKKISQGNILIQPKKEVTVLETYFGPQHIVASKQDYSMFVTIPTDIHDNPNKISFSAIEMFKDIEQKSIINLSEIIHYKKIFSKTKKGKIFIQTKSQNVISKEFEATILASNPVDFRIDFDRNHSYADGKELTTLTTSVIKDKFGNIIENGTLVSFLLKTHDKTLKVHGKTINGVAKAQNLHPKKAQNFEVTAYINGFAKSNNINIEYKLR